MKVGKDISPANFYLNNKLLLIIYHLYFLSKIILIWLLQKCFLIGIKYRNFILMLD